MGWREYCSNGQQGIGEVKECITTTREKLIYILAKTCQQFERRGIHDDSIA